jgi:hypothetical protein
VQRNQRLPQLDGGLFLTDGGLETVLIFHQHMELPEFAAFPLLEDTTGTAALRDYYRPYLELARERRAGFVLESPTWRANPDWAQRLGYGPQELDQANRRAIGIMQELRQEFSPDVAPIVISGCIGPQSDGYSPTTHLTPDAAREYHAVQITTFAETEADMITVMTMTYADEAVGVARRRTSYGRSSLVRRSRTPEWRRGRRGRRVPVDELDDHAVGITHLERALPPLLAGQRHGDGDTLGLEPGELTLEVVHRQGEDEPAGVVVALVRGQSRQAPAEEDHVDPDVVAGQRGEAVGGHLGAEAEVVD